jgi:hypothetical protein
MTVRATTTVIYIYILISIDNHNIYIVICKLNIRPEDVDKFLESWASGAKTMKQPAWIHIHTASSRDFW